MDRRTARELLARLERDAARIARAFDLRYRVIEAERANVKRRYGVCYSDGTIRIRLRHARTGRPLKYSSLVSTLCHELAHLRHFHHGPSFQRFYAKILRWARREGIYRPGGPLREAPRRRMAWPAAPAIAPRTARSTPAPAPTARTDSGASPPRSAPRGGAARAGAAPRRGSPEGPRQLGLFDGAS